MWPYLLPINVTSKSQLLRFLHQERTVQTNVPILVVAEKNRSFVGVDLMLELSPFRSKVMIVRMDIENKHLLQDLEEGDSSVTSLPLIFEIDHGDYTVKKLEVPEMKAHAEESEVTSVIVKFLVQKFHLPVVGNTSEEHAHERGQDHEVADQIRRPDSKGSGADASSKEPVEVNSSVYMTDLYNALRYSIFNQITMRTQFNSSQLAAFQGFLKVIDAYFPFPEEDSKASGFIQLLTKWSLTKDHYLSTDDLTAEMAQIEDDFYLPDMKPYKGCAGSSPRFRGYPCSLWTLFHALTVHEYQKQSSSQLEPHSVLPAMKDFILNFFGCTDCAAHFAQESEKMEDALIHPNSSVIWLWKTHNRVNTRLAGDQTQDPLHPKIQFPPKTLCPHCHSLSSTSSHHNKIFNETEVFRFLVDRFLPENIIKEEKKVMKSKEQNKSNFHPRKVVFDHDHEHTWSQESGEPLSPTRHITALLNRTDITLFVILYVFSVTLLISLFLYFKYKGGRGKKKQLYYQLSNPNLKYMA